MGKIERRVSEGWLPWLQNVATFWIVKDTCFILVKTRVNKSTNEINELPVSFIIS
jgi:hypothetical protein